MSELVLRQLRVPAALPAAGTRGGETRIGALADEVTLHLGESRHHMKEEASGRCPGVNAVGDAAELDSASLQVFDERYELPNRAPKPVKLPDDEPIAGAKMGECLG